MKVDCHEVVPTSRNDNKKVDSSDNAPFPSLRGSEATEAIHKPKADSSVKVDFSMDCHEVLRLLAMTMCFVVIAKPFRAEAIHKDKAQKVDSSAKVDCHADFQSARNDKKEVDCHEVLRLLAMTMCFFRHCEAVAIATTKQSIKMT